MPKGAGQQREMRVRILAYADRLSARPGEAVEIKVSCDGPARYEAELVRIVQGDINPDGPGYREDAVDVDLGGPFEGRLQPIHTGSYGIIEDNEAFRDLSTFTAFAAIWPTMPGEGPQTILARRDPHTGAGFELFLNDSGALEFTVAASAAVASSVFTEHPLEAQRWYLVAATLSAQDGRMTVTQHRLPPHPLPAPVATVTCEGWASVVPSHVAAPLTVAARPAPDRPAERHFNGRLERPCLYASVLSLDDMIAGLEAGSGSTGDDDLVAAWDFSIGISSHRMVDVSPRHLDGTLVNLPTRGVTGRHGNADAFCWQQTPERYAAIHFHDDDLYDAGWDTDFALEVPNGLRSGLYAVRLHADEDEFYVPLAVLPPRDGPKAAAAFLLPTASYMAYANNRIALDVPETEIVIGRLLEHKKQDLFMQEHPELGLCFYDVHNDGSGVFYSSRLRPVVGMQPKIVGALGGAGSNLWQFNADTHILGWLEHCGERFDVITDEDLHQEGLSLLENYRVVLTGSHPEYHSAAMLDALEAFVHRGGRLMYLGGNGFYWRISFNPTLPGVIECRKSEVGIRAYAPLPGEFFASFTGEYTGLWRRNGRPPNRLVGVGMVSQGFDVSAPYRRTQASRDARAAFIFEGVDDEIIGDFGLSGGGAAGLELDAVDHALGTPEHALVLASSERHTDVYLMTPEDMLDPVPGLGGTEADIIRSDMVFFETPGGGAVFSTGSIAWAGSMAWNGYDNHVAAITANVLRRFIARDPFNFPGATTE